MTGYSESLFKDPNIFKPERWLNEGMGKIQPFAFIPWGVGPRMCIGKCLHSLTWTQGELEEFRQLRKPEMQSKICITLDNPSQPYECYVNTEKVLYCFYRIFLVTAVFSYSHLNSPINQSECLNYLEYIKKVQASPQAEMISNKLCAG